MAIPALLYVASATQALPVVTAAVRGRDLPAPHRRVAIFCCMLVLLDVADLLVGASSGNNRWTAYVTLPLEVAMTLWILSAWQAPGWERHYRRAIPAVVGATALALVATDPARTFDLWVSPFLALFALAAALHTLVSRTLRSATAVGGLDWFWICLGLAIFWVVQVSSPVFAFTFMNSHMDWVVLVLVVRAGFMIVAFLCIAWGILWRPTPSR